MEEEEGTFVCDLCGEKLNMAKYDYESDDNTCIECFKEYSFCLNCGGIDMENEICDECYEDGCRVCESCGDIFDTEFPEAERSLCPLCIQDKICTKG